MPTKGRDLRQDCTPPQPRRRQRREDGARHTPPLLPPTPQPHNTRHRRDVALRAIALTATKRHAPLRSLLLLGVHLTYDPATARQPPPMTEIVAAIEGGYVDFLDGDAHAFLRPHARTRRRSAACRKPRRRDLRLRPRRRRQSRAGTSRRPPATLAREKRRRRSPRP